MAIELTDSTIDKIVDRLITKGNDFSETESEKIKRNTKALFQNYRLLESHVDIDMPVLEEDTPLNKYELTLYSLLGYRARSKEMIIFLNKVLDRYEAICMAGTAEQQRRYKVIKTLYINTETMTRVKLAEKFGCDEKTIRRDERKAINELGVMIFGIDSLNDVSK
ncbi:hypothetical protein [Secundilactobacillus muriivasis]